MPLTCTRPHSSRTAASSHSLNASGSSSPLLVRQCTAPSPPSPSSAPPSPVDSTPHSRWASGRSGRPAAAAAAAAMLAAGTAGGRGEQFDVTGACGGAPGR